MPLLLRRRSVLDLLNGNADKEELPRPESNGLRPATPSSPRPVSEYGFPASRLSHELRRDEVSSDEATAPKNSRAKRFSIMKLRNFSESHLGQRAREDAAKVDRPPMPAMPSTEGVPSIVRTAPTMDHGELQDETGEERSARPSMFKRSPSNVKTLAHREPRKSVDERTSAKSRGSSLRWRRMQGRSTGLEDLARLSALHVNDPQSAPPSYGDESSSALALPMPNPRFSESSQSDGSNGSSGDQIYGQTTTTTHTVSHTTFFKLPRRNKNRNSLFPLPIKLPAPSEHQAQANEPATPRASTSAWSTKSSQTPQEHSPPGTVLQRRHTEASPTKQRGEAPPPLPSTSAALARSSLSFAEHGLNLARNESQRSRNSSTSSPLQPPMRLGLRDRASTASSVGRASHDMDTPPPMNGSARNSTSTTGRSSLGGFLNLSRFRQSSDPHSPRHGSPGSRSKSNSFAMSREALVVPEREEGDTPGKYLERLEAAVARSMIAGILSKSADPFAQSVLRSYTRRFMFFGEPIDMSLRKFLLEAELPKETQQVDRVVQAFADRYHECNPGIFMSPDQAYIIAFSLMMLHTDAFNKNNKRKMQKHDYIKNTSGQQVADEVLGCFYDNICYTPFVHYEEEVDINGERVMPFKPKKSKLKGAINETTGKKPTGPVDPYNLLVDQKLDVLRPPVKDSIMFDDPYNYRGTQGELDPHYLQRAFTHTGILQIISARSRPSAYEGQFSVTNPNPIETQAGIIDLKITKVGTLWRKAAKKKKARSPWQEWGAILTGSQLYLFKNAHWAKGLVHQFVAAQRHGHPRTPVIFKPPLTDFKPDALIKTDNAVALVDSTYSRHKHAFTFFRAGGHEEVLLADNEPELNDWIALINYAAAFRAAGVRIRGMVGGNEEDLRRQDVRRLDSTHSTQSVQTSSGEVTVMRGGLSLQLQRQVMAARRQIMVQKIAEEEKEIAEANRQLDGVLRNARHLLLLAPIAPKTREDIVHAAAKTDAMIKWSRRDIWRMRCHKDVLAMDVHQDGVSASELQALTNHPTAGPEASRRDKPSGLARLESKASVAHGRSPPQSPTSPARSARSARPSTQGSIETFMGNDVFRTLPESATEHKQGGGYRLPPLQLDVHQRDEHRTSISSTLLSVSSPGRGSLSHASSTSSIHQLDRLPSPQPSEAPSRRRVTPTPSVEDREVEMLARTTMTPETIVASASGVIGLDDTPYASTPESKRKSARRSLQKTLRDAHHHQSSIHKHRRNKESDGTVRSVGGDAEELVEGTPGLQREKGRFILHGKQASVIQFGSEWPNERMKQRREMWRTNSGSPKDENGPRRQMSETDSQMTSPSTTRELRFGADASGSEDGSASTARSPNFREDAEAAEAYAMSASPPRRKASNTSTDGGAVGFDLSSWDPSLGKRQTVIGPLPPQRKFSLRKSEEGMVESDEEDFTLGPRDRRTVIGPSFRVNGGWAASHLGGSAATNGGAEQDEEDRGMEDDSMVSAPIDDDELRRISEHGAEAV
ncbi:hypothetical protein LTR85_005015 [Meristemomyces frigidus]|nr:hypothetical protein LTR85_005015 [Meristemomyces frigidus]